MRPSGSCVRRALAPKWACLPYKEIFSLWSPFSLLKAIFSLSYVQKSLYFWNPRSIYSRCVYAFMCVCVGGWRCCGGGMSWLSWVVRGECHQQTVLFIAPPFFFYLVMPAQPTLVHLLRGFHSEGPPDFQKLPFLWIFPVPPYSLEFSRAIS